jgi:hypothetical protein
MINILEKNKIIFENEKCHKENMSEIYELFK